MEIQIEFPTKKAAKNFAKWFRTEGFDLFTSSKINRKVIHSSEDFITCLATDEKLTDKFTNNYAGNFFDLQ